MRRRKPIILSTPEGRHNFYASPEWNALRRLKLVRNPFCEECVKSNLTTMAVDVHHVIEVAVNPLLSLNIDNLMALCKSCHSKITVGVHLKQTFEVDNLKWKFKLN